VAITETIAGLGLLLSRNSIDARVLLGRLERMCAGSRYEAAVNRIDDRLARFDFKGAAVELGGLAAELDVVRCGKRG